MSSTAHCPNPKCARVSTVDGARPPRCPACGSAFDTVAGGPAPLPAAVSVAAVGRFQVKAKLGAGAFGTVYRAFDPHLEREVAQKVPNPGVLSDAKRVERFLREAKAAANLRHPHIVPVFDAGKDAGRYFIAAAFIDGKPLADTIDEKGTDFRRAARLVRELADALAYAHDQGIVHRDVKPANAMVDAADRLHLMDFGLAARAEDADEAKLTNDGAVMGTPAYMAPEQAAGQMGDAKPAADQYAAGVVLYELLTGQTPFEGPPAIVLFNAVNTTPDPPRKRRPAVPKDLETVCLKAMAKRPADRYPSCHALADDLRRWLDGDPITARRLSLPEQLGRWAKKNRGVAAATAVAFAALVLGTAVSVAFGVAAAVAAGRADNEAPRATGALADAERDRDAAVAAQKAEAAAKAGMQAALVKEQDATATAVAATRTAEQREAEAKAAAAAAMKARAAEGTAKAGEESALAAAKKEAVAALAAKAAADAGLGSPPRGGESAHQAVGRGLPPDRGRCGWGDRHVPGHR